MVYNYVKKEDRILIIRVSGEVSKAVGVILEDKNGIIGVKLASFIIMNAKHTKELNRQVESFEREVLRKRNSPLLF